MFNTQLFQCAFGMSGGYGDDIGDFHGMRLAETSQFMLEAVIHQRLLERKDLLVADPADADVFFIPYYAHMAFLCLRSKRVPENVAEELVPYFGEDAKKLDFALFDTLNEGPWLKRNGGVDHAVVVGAIGRESAFELSLGTGVHFAAEREAENLTIGTLEAWSTWGLTAHFVTVPYPSSLHCLSPARCGASAANDAPNSTSKSGLSDATSNRSRLALFIGDPERSFVRQALMRNLAQFPKDATVVNTMSLIGGFYDHLRHFVEMMTDTVFCLEPPGDSPTRKGFFDALLAGCIPVVFGDGIWDSAPFEGELPVAFENYTVWLPEPASAMQDLKAISAERIDELQRNGRLVAWALNYPAPGASADGDALEHYLRAADRRRREAVANNANER